jgi:hypothetical protein
MLICRESALWSVQEMSTNYRDSKDAKRAITTNMAAVPRARSARVTVAPSSSTRAPTAASPPAAVVAATAAPATPARALLAPSRLAPASLLSSLLPLLCCKMLDVGLGDVMKVTTARCRKHLDFKGPFVTTNVRTAIAPCCTRRGEDDTQRETQTRSRCGNIPCWQFTMHHNVECVR